MPTTLSTQQFAWYQQIQKIAQYNKDQIEIARQMQPAIASADAETVQRLLNTLPTRFIINYLYEAVMSGHTDIVELFLKHGANVNLATISFHPQKPIHAAILNNDLKMVKLLVQSGANYWIPDFVPIPPSLYEMYRIPERQKTAFATLQPIPADYPISPLYLAQLLAKRLEYKQIDAYLKTHIAEMEQQPIKKRMSIQYITTPHAENNIETAQLSSPPRP